MCKKTVLLFLVGMIIGLIGAEARAQADRAALVGTVTDNAGAAIAGAKVEVLAPGTGLRRQAMTNDQGYYSIPFLPIGAYVVTVERDGFAPVKITDIALQVGETRTLDVELKPGSVQAEIEVVAGTELERSSATIGAVIQSSQVHDLPLNGRHWASLMALAPGAINTGLGNQQSIRFNGRARDDNNWTFDGVDATGVKDPRQEVALRLIISTDSIAEFRVNSTLYSAESGAGAGGQINLVSRTGSNQFRGSAYEFLRNNVLDARNPFDPARKPPFRLNQFGGNLGGPIIQSKTFFFINYEGLRQRQGQTFIGFVPSAAFRARAIATSPAVQPIVEAYPRGTSSTSNADIDRIETERRFVTREDSATIRIDHHFTERSTLFVRYNVDDAVVNEPTSPGIERTLSRFRPSNVALQFQHVFSSNLINETKIGMNRSPLTRETVGAFDKNISVTGFFTLSDSSGEIEKGTSFSLIDNLAIIRGRHNLKMGGEIRRIHVNVGNGIDSSVSYTSLEDLVRNRVNNISVNLPLATRGERRTYYLPYIQDDIKLKPNLTINLGLRYEYYSVAHEVRDRARVFDFACGGFCPPGSPWYFPDRNNFDPRVGFAWSPERFKGKTIIRGGFGVFHGPGQNDDVNAAIDSDAERFSLTRSEVPALSFPIEPFLGLARNQGVTPRALQRNRRDLYTQSWGLYIQQVLPLNFVMQVGYTGSSAHKLFSRNFVNVIDPATGRRPLPQFGRIDSKENLGNSNFNALQVSLHRQMRGGLLIGMEYMWSHSINDNSIGGGEAAQPQNVFDRRSDRANSNEDIRHTFTTSYIYQLPFGSGRRFLNQSGAVDRILGGWSLSGITTARTGRPLTISVSRSSSDLPDGNNSNQRPDIVPGVPLIPPGGQTSAQWLNPAAFRVPARGTWGNAGRNIARGPGLVQFDLALTKRTKLTEKQDVEFRFEAFNVFNRAQLGNPGTNISSPTSFGVITSPLNRNIGTGTSRQLQFMLRLNF